MMDRIWRCRSGKLVPVRQMSDDHLHNCIKLIQVTGWRAQWLDRLTLEVLIRTIEREGKEG